MKKLLKKLPLFLTVFLLFIVSCSKEDTVKEPTGVKGVEAFRYQVMTIDLTGKVLSENEYQGTFDGVAVSLTKSEDNKLLFLLPYSTTIGVHTLIIPSLNNATVIYDVKDTVLPGTTETTLVPLFSNLDAYAKKLTSSSPEALNVKNNLTSFKNYFNNASNEDKKQIAMAYQANKSKIDEVILKSFGNLTKKTTITNKDKLILSKFLFSVASIEIGSWMAVSGGHPGVRGLGIVVAGIATATAIDYYKQFIENEVKEIGVSIGSILGLNNKNSSTNVLTFKDNVASVLPINTLKRKLNATDASAKQELVISFFKSKEGYNYLINKVNSAIQYLNNNNSFFTFNTFELAELPSATNSVQFATTDEVFGKFMFSINHPNLQLVTSTLQSDGQLNLNIKITGAPASLPVESFLNYSYSDDFSAFSGKLPIKVTKDFVLAGMSFDNKSVIGTACCNWDMKFAFQGNLTPIGGQILAKTLWDNTDDGFYEGNIDGAFVSIPITNQNSKLNIVTHSFGFCWGASTTKLKVQYKYVSLQGIESALFETGVPR